MVMPLLRKNKVVGLFELFSSLPQAFGERDERTVEALATRILSNLDRAAQPPPPVPRMPAPQTPSPETAAPENEFLPPAEVALPEFSESAILEKGPQLGVDVVTWALRGAVLVCAIILGLLLGWHVAKPKAVVRRRPVAPALATINPAPANAAPVVGSASAKPESNAGAPAPRSGNTSSRATGNSAPPGSLQVFENGKEIFRMPPAKNEAELNAGTGEQGEGLSRQMG